MGNVHSTKTPTKELTQDTLETYSTLLSMGFDGTICIDAATRYPKQIDSAINYILEQQMQNNSDLKTQKSENIDEKMPRIIDCFSESVEKCPALNRIIDAMKLYQEHYEFDQKLSKYSENMKSLIINYHHILNEHLNEMKYGNDKTNQEFQCIYNKMMNENNLYCDIMKCSIYLRNNREREKSPIKADDIYLHTFMDIMDCIHCYFIHSVDIGYRCFINQNIIDGIDNISQLKSYLSSKRAKLERIRGKSRLSNSKFATNLECKDSAEFVNDDIKQDLQDDKQENMYSFGTRFDYWRNRSPLFSKKKYSTLKAELCNNKLFTISINVFDAAYAKAENLMNNSPKIRALLMYATLSSISETNHILPFSSKLNVDNVLSIIFYTDYDTLSSNFSKSFRKISQNETFEQIQERNREYWNWSKLLIETVNGYGRTVRASNNAIFYHGTTYVHFSSLITVFNSPTSTTTKLTVAAMFAQNDGIILELNKYTDHSSWCTCNGRKWWHELRYFDCSFVSNFGNEDEKLFVHPPHVSKAYWLEFKSIRLMKTGDNLKSYIKTITEFKKLSSKGYSADKANHNEHKLETEFEPISLCTALNSTDNDDVTKYIAKLIKMHFYDVQQIEIDLWRIHSSSFKDIEDSTRTDLIAFDNINTIFHNVSNIKIINATSIDKPYAGYFDALLSQIKNINSKQYSKLNKIRCCYSPVANINANDLREEYGKRADDFDANDWHIMLLSPHYNLASTSEVVVFRCR